MVMWNYSLNISSDDLAEERLREWNESLTLRLIPNDVILALYLAVGIVGNSTVLCVYGLRFHGQHRERYFVPFLALADLLACITCVTFTFYLNFHQADFRNETFCKVMWPLSTGTTFVSVFMLLVITIERYYKVCKPFHDLKHRKLILIVILSLAVLIASPSPLFFGTRVTFIPERNLTRYRCTVIKDINSPGPNIYGFVLGMFSILTPVTIAAVYIRIGWKLRGQMKFRKQFTYSKRSNEVSERDFAKGAHSCDVLFLEDQHPGTYIKLKKEQINFDHEHSNSTECSEHDDGRPNDSVQRSSKGHQKGVSHVSLSRQINEVSLDKKRSENDDKDSVDDGFRFKAKKSRIFSKTDENPLHDLSVKDEKQTTTFFNLSLSKGIPTEPKGTEEYFHRNRGDIFCYGSAKVSADHHYNVKTSCSANEAFCALSKSNERLGRRFPEVPVRRHVTSRNGHLYPSLGMHRFTVMFMLITGICCLCYLPKITLLILETVMTSFWVSIPDQYLGLVLFLYRFYIFNNVCNPIIYCLFDFRFRREIKGLCCRRRALFT